ncbi:uncharacterized protein DMAD_00416 [Drosophila madeirensis]|uniref:Uncharacterized protein n=1 Tax=Drosophila madeirensis TaxID=30013 RepID=A0AAU9FXS2_DROMD
MFWLYLVYVLCLVLMLAIYCHSAWKERALCKRCRRINRLSVHMSLLLIEMKLVLETSRDGQQLEQVELRQMNQSVDRFIRRLEYTRQELLL